MFDNRKDSCPCSWKLIPCQSKSTVWKYKSFIDFTHHKRKNSRLNFFLLTAIRKYIIFLTMTMKIKTANNFFIFTQLPYLWYYCMNLRMDLFHWITPVTIYIETCQITTEITVYYTIHIQHWKYVKFIMF